LNFDSLEDGVFTRFSLKFGSISARDYIFEESGLGISHTIEITHPSLTYSNCEIFDT
jgi:hypothetical protein